MREFFRILFDVTHRYNPEDPKSPLRYPSGWLYDALGVVKTDAGVNVNETTAMTYATVYACVRVLAEAVAALPLYTYENMTRGKRDARNHRAFRVLHDEPNPDMTSFSFREAMMACVLLWGNGYAEIQWDGAGRLKHLWPLLPSAVKPEHGKSGRGNLIYRIDGNKRVIFAADMLHIPGLSFDGITGLSPIAQHRNAIGLGMAAQTYGSKFFSNNATPAGALEHPGTVDEDAARRIRESWEGMYQGTDRAHRIAVLEDGMKFTSIGIPAKDAQFLETRQFQRNEICAIYRVPPHMVGDLSRATFSNIEQQSIDFYVNTLVPWLKRWEGEINRKLFSGIDRTRYFSEFKVAGLLRGDAQTRSAYYRELFGIGVLSRNDIRELENMNPAKQGDAYYVPMNMVEVGEKKEPAPAAPAAPAGEPPAEPAKGKPAAPRHLGLVFWDAMRRAQHYTDKNEERRRAKMHEALEAALLVMAVEIHGDQTPRLASLLDAYANELIRRIEYDVIRHHKENGEYEIAYQTIRDAIMEETK